MTGRRTRTLVVAMTLAMLGAVAGSGSPAVGASGPTYRFAPPFGAVGDTIHVVGSDCEPAGLNRHDGRLVVWRGIDTTEGSFMVIQHFSALDAAGHFAFTFEIPPGDFPLGDHATLLFCINGETYGPTFRLTAPRVPTTVSRTTSTSSLPTTTSSSTTTTTVGSSTSTTGGPTTTVAPTSTTRPSLPPGLELVRQLLESANLPSAVIDAFLFVLWLFG